MDTKFTKNKVEKKMADSFPYPKVYSIDQAVIWFLKNEGRLHCIDGTHETICVDYLEAKLFFRSIYILTKLKQQTNELF